MKFGGLWECTFSNANWKSFSETRLNKEFFISKDIDDRYLIPLLRGHQVLGSLVVSAGPRVGHQASVWPGQHHSPPCRKRSWQAQGHREYRLASVRMRELLARKSPLALSLELELVFLEIHLLLPLEVHLIWIPFHLSRLIKLRWKSLELG